MYRRTADALPPPLKGPNVTVAANTVEERWMAAAGGATDFLSTKVSADSITFENPQHDFPKTIVYTKRADGGFDVTISGPPGQRALTYSFKKKQ